MSLITLLPSFPKYTFIFELYIKVRLDVYRLGLHGNSQYRDPPHTHTHTHTPPPPPPPIPPTTTTRRPPLKCVLTPSPHGRPGPVAPRKLSRLHWFHRAQLTWSYKRSLEVCRIRNRIVIVTLRYQSMLKKKLPGYCLASVISYCEHWESNIRHKMLLQVALINASDVVVIYADHINKHGAHGKMIKKTYTRWSFPDAVLVTFHLNNICNHTEIANMQTWIGSWVFLGIYYTCFLWLIFHHLCNKPIDPMRVSTIHKIPPDIAKWKHG